MTREERALEALEMSIRLANLLNAMDSDIYEQGSLKSRHYVLGTLAGEPCRKAIEIATMIVERLGYSAEEACNLSGIGNYCYDIQECLKGEF